MNPEAPTTTKATILLIEDDAASRKILDFVLTSAGYQVQKAAGGDEGLELASSLPDDESSIILMDFQMPGLSGCDLATNLRQKCKAQIIAMSGAQIPDELLSAFDGFLLKPFEIPELKGQIEKTLQKASESKEPHTNLALNEAIFQKLSSTMSMEALQEVYDTCIKDAGHRLQELESAARRGDSPAVHKAAHQIRGGCSMLGAEEAAAIAQKLEMGDGEHSELLLEIENLRSAFAKLERILLTKFWVK